MVRVNRLEHERQYISRGNSVDTKDVLFQSSLPSSKLVPSLVFAQSR